MLVKIIQLNKKILGFFLNPIPAFFTPLAITFSCSYNSFWSNIVFSFIILYLLSTLLLFYCETYFDTKNKFKYQKDTKSSRDVEKPKENNDQSR